MPRIILIGILLSAASLTTAPSLAASGPIYPVIPQFGGVMPMPSAAERPDPKLHYRVVFSITKAAPSADKLNPSLEKVARFVNLLGADKVRPAPGEIVAIVHGAATPLILQNADYALRTKAVENPNIALIAALRKAGVSVRVCSQAMIGQGITPPQLTPGIEVDDSALTTIATLQLRGYALIPD